jgi:ribonucleoside-triphosphate reductase
MFGDFYYPDGTKPEWEAVDRLQRLFMNWFNERRLKSVLTFPVETFCMVYDDKDYIDQDYKKLCAEMYAKGHSFFTYISDSVDSLASCCRLRNKLQKNTFSPTSGMTGLKTGSCNVITLNLNRIVQSWARQPAKTKEQNNGVIDKTVNMPGYDGLKEYLIDILEVVYKAHISFKHLLYREEDRGMYSVSNGGYIHMKDLYSTIGINGHNEAARFLGLEVSWNEPYVGFLQLILSTIKEQNELHSIEDKKYPIRFNSEVIPAESVGGKNYRWDKADGFWVPDDENLYNSYFYDAHDNTSVLDKFRLHGNATYQFTDGGSALHCNLEDHLSKEQYLKLLDFARENGTQYFTFNIPNSECDDCHFITKHPLTKCPKCGSEHITQYSRVIGYLTATKTWGSDRQIEGAHRTYSDGKSELKDF